MSALVFIAASAAIVYAARRLARDGDVIALRTGLGHMFVGTLLLALATSLPELLTMISSINEEEPSLAAGNIFGSCMFNMFLLALLDMAHRRAHILRSVALNHAVSAGLAVLSLAAAVLFVQADIEVSLGWFGADSAVLVGLYLVGARMTQGGTAGRPDRPAAERGAEEAASKARLDAAGLPGLRAALVSFTLHTALLLLVTPPMVRSAIEIAEATGLSTGFVGAALVGVVTSLPEAATTWAAARIGAYDLAVGNLFGSNMFNVFALGITDAFYTEGRFLGAVDPVMALAGLLALVLTALGLVGNVARLERRVLAVEMDALAIAAVYVLGMWLLYSRGLVV